MKKLFSGPQHFAKVRYNHPEAPVQLTNAISVLGQETRLAGTDILILCIGTDRSTGDSLGPLVGTRLLDMGLNVPVLGCLDQPIHAGNLSDTIDTLQRDGRRRWVLAVDASLGSMDSVGHVNVGKGSLQPGAGVNKRLPAVGDIYITGVVNVGGFMEYFVLQNTRLSLIFKMANLIAHSISEALPQAPKTAINQP
jgi:putative sporulation protein YyaC